MSQSQHSWVQRAVKTNAEYPLYMATWTDAEGNTLTATPFYAQSDADAREAGETMVPLLPEGGRVRVLDFTIGFWDGARFSTGSDRLIFDSQAPEEDH